MGLSYGRARLLTALFRRFPARAGVLASTPRAAGFFDHRVAPVLRRVVASKEMLLELFEGSTLAARLGA